jgi:hypothetical protein
VTDLRLLEPRTWKGVAVGYWVESNDFLMFSPTGSIREGRGMWTYIERL